MSDLNKIEKTLLNNSKMDDKLLKHLKTKRLTELLKDVKKQKELYIKNAIIYNDNVKIINNKIIWNYVLLAILILLIIIGCIIYFKYINI